MPRVSFFRELILLLSFMLKSNKLFDPVRPELTCPMGMSKGEKSIVRLKQGKSMKLKTLTVIAGANGSGKTTFALEYIKIKQIKFINADEIAKALDPNDITAKKISAGKEFFARFSEYITDEKSFALESTLSGRYLEKLLRLAKQNGYSITIVYLFVESPQVSIDRIKIRVLNGGHFVPDEDVKRRFYRSKKLFWQKYRLLADGWFVYYNTDDTFEKIAEQKNDKIEIYDSAKWDELLKDTQ
jgi:predicted ABC-type ATPase